MVTNRIVTVTVTEEFVVRLPLYLVRWRIT